MPQRYWTSFGDIQMKIRYSYALLRYAPEDITATVENPVEVWDQFCREAGIQHNGLDVPEQQIPLGIF